MAVPRHAVLPESARAVRLGITQVLVDRARHNQEIYRVQVLLSQLCERYHKARKEDGRPVLHMTELAQIKGTLQQCRAGILQAPRPGRRRGRDDRRSLPGFRDQQPDRHFAVLSDLIHRTLPFGDGTVGVPTARPMPVDD